MTLQKICTAELGAAVKADCYGLGMVRIAPVLAQLGCRHFFVANKDEGVALRRLLKEQNIYVLHGYFTGDKDDFLQNNLIPVINCLEQLKIWQNLALELDKNLPCFLHINTGMNRYGMPAYEVEQVIGDGSYLNKIDVLCVMSHLSSSEDRDNPSNNRQLEAFKHLASFFPKAKKSLVSSSGVFLGKSYHFDIVRPGGSLYGINPAPYLTESGIRNPITLTAPIIQLNHVTMGQYVGYNETHVAIRDTVIATLPLGYGDGYPRSLSNKGIVFINGRPAKVVGRVSMDLTNIDVTDIPKQDVFLGQRVEIIGPNIDFDKIASIAGTNGYEFLTNLSNRYQRVYN